MKAEKRKSSFSEYFESSIKNNVKENEIFKKGILDLMSLKSSYKSSAKD